MDAVRIYLGLGSNLGDRRGALESAVGELGALMDVDSVSGIYRSDPVGYREQPEFWNVVIAGRTALGPEELLHGIQEIERAHGRARTFRNAPRPIDIDILLYGQRVIRGSDLEIPHPRMGERAFVLRPLLEVAPALRDPRTGHPVSELLASLVDDERTERIADPPPRPRE